MFSPPVFMIKEQMKEKSFARTLKPPSPLHLWKRWSPEQLASQKKLFF